MTLTFVAATAEPSWLDAFLQWANADDALGPLLLIFGIAAQALFFCRWIVQWLVSEGRGESSIPIAFWWLSLSGATLLLVYYLLRGEPVGILGQCTGWLIYTRNLVLIQRARRNKAA